MTDPHKLADEALERAKDVTPLGYAQDEDGVVYDRDCRLFSDLAQALKDSLEEIELLREGYQRSNEIEQAHLVERVAQLEGALRNFTYKCGDRFDRHGLQRSTVTLTVSWEKYEEACGALTPTESRQNPQPDTADDIEHQNREIDLARRGFESPEEER